MACQMCIDGAEGYDPRCSLPLTFVFAHTHAELRVEKQHFKLASEGSLGLVFSGWDEKDSHAKLCYILRRYIGGQHSGNNM